MQHGFRPGRSTSSAAPTVAEIVNNALNDNRLVAGIFIDLRKAFDTVDHVILLDKMERYGFRGHVSNFFRSYLSAMCQKVIINNLASQSRPVTVGVPQGSVLGPLLFSLYINDLPNVVSNSSCVMYADDTCFFTSGSSIDQIRSSAQELLEHINVWLRSNKLTLNITKTSAVIFRSSWSKVRNAMLNVHVDGELIHQVDKVKYLGIILDEHLR